MIRHATTADLNAIIAIYNQAVQKKLATADLDPIRVEDRHGWFHLHTQGEFPIFVYELAGRVVGWCSLDPYRSGRRALSATSEIVYYVDYEFHRRGIGSMLVEHALAEASQLGKRALFAIILESNVPSIRLLEKFGFDRWAYLPDVADIDGKLVSHVYYGKQLHANKV